jgi:hypothetical protein
MAAHGPWSRPAGEELGSDVPQIADFQTFIFIVGAPRSGTTTMSRLLQEHPQVAFPFVKETHYFAQHDLRTLGDEELRRRVEADYLNRFFHDPRPGEIAGTDGSVSYLYVPEQLEPALKLWPDSRFIVGVRDPMSLLPSLHQRLIYTGDENITSFADAWAAIPDRAAGRRVPRSCIEPRWLRYDEAGRFATYLERLYAAVGRERCMVVVHDDLAADAAGQQQRILEFAGLDPMPALDVGVRRESRGVRYPWLQRLLKRPPRFMHSYLAGKQFKQRFEGSGDGKGNSGSGKVSLRKRLLRWNRIEPVKQPVPLQVQQEIRAHFQDEIDRLGVLIGRDLSHWLQPRSS